MIVKIDDSILSYDDNTLYEFLSVVLDMSKYHRDSFFISSNSLINSIKRLEKISSYDNVTIILKRLDSSYSTTMSIHLANIDTFLLLSIEENNLKITLYKDKKIHYSYFSDIKEISEKIINSQIYFENQSDADFIEAVIKTKHDLNTMLENIKQPSGGNTIIDKYEQGLKENKLWFFVVDEDICIDTKRIQNSISKSCEDLSNKYDSLAYHISTISRSIENLIPMEIIHDYLDKFGLGRQKALFNKMLKETDYYNGFYVREGIRKDMKGTIREELKSIWRNFANISCPDLSDKCINSNMCNLHDFSDILFSGLTIGKHNLLNYATKAINDGFQFSLVGNLKLLSKKIYEISASNSDLQNLIWGI